MAKQLQTNIPWSQQRHFQIIKRQSTSLQRKMGQQSPINAISTITNIVRNPSEHSDYNAGNTNNDDLRCSVTNHSVASTESFNLTQSTGFVTLQNFTTDKIKRIPLIKCAVVIIILLVVAGISATVALLTRHEPNTPPAPEPYITPVEMSVRLNDYYNDDMSNTSSEVYTHFKNSFCTNLTNTLLTNTSGVTCQVNSVRKGSIIVNCTVYIIDDEKPTEERIMGILKSIPPWENVSLIKSNINITIGKSEELSVVFPKEMGIFECSSGRGTLFLPLNNTYPDNCSAFQICEKGIGTPVFCGSSLQFAINESSVCKKSEHSTSTYCDKRMLRDSTVKLPDVNCTNLHGVILPSPNTYPNNCNQYIECVHSRPLVRICANCNYFTEDPHVCDWYYANNTYCAKKKASENGDNSIKLLPECTMFSPGTRN